MDGVASSVGAVGAVSPGGERSAALPPPEASPHRRIIPFLNPLALAGDFVTLNVPRRTTGDLEHLIREQLKEQPGTTVLYQAFLDQAWANIPARQLRRDPRNALQPYLQLAAVVGLWMTCDLAGTPWTRTAVRWAPQNVDDDRVYLEFSSAALPRSPLADLFHDIMISDFHRLGQPVDLELTDGDRFQSDAIQKSLKGRIAAMKKLYDTRGAILDGLDRLHPSWDHAALGEFWDEWSEIAKTLQEVDQALDRGNDSLLRQRLVELLHHPIVCRKSRMSHLLQHLAEEARSFGPGAAHTFIRVRGTAFAMLDGGLLAFLDDALLLFGYKAINGQIGEDEIDRAVRLVVERSRLMHRHLLSMAPSVPSDLGRLGLTWDSELPEHLSTMAESLEARLSVAQKESGVRRKILLAVACRDALVTAHGSHVSEKVGHQVQSMPERADDRKVWQAFQESGDYFASAQRASARTMEELLSRADAQRDEAAASAGAELIAVEEAAQAAREARRPAPSSGGAAAAAAAVKPSIPAPPFQQPPEPIDIATIHASVAALPGEGAKLAMRDNLAHVLAQLHELKGQGSARDEVNLLRQAIEFALRYSLDDPNSVEGHHLENLAVALPDGRLGGVARHHAEIIQTLARGNICANYPVETARRFQDPRTLWLLQHVAGETEEARPGVVQSTLALIYDLVQTTIDPDYCVEEPREVVWQADSDEQLPSPPEADVAASSASIEALPARIDLHSDAQRAVQMMQSWVDLHLTVPGSQVRQEALAHARIYLRELEARLGSVPRLMRPIDSCWGELNWCHRLVKSLLVACIGKPTMENNPRILARQVRGAPPMPEWIGMVHGIFSFPTKGDGTRWTGELAGALYRADAESGVNAMRLVGDFERKWIYPLLDVAWRLARDI